MIHVIIWIVIFFIWYFYRVYRASVEEKEREYDAFYESLVNSEKDKEENMNVGKCLDERTINLANQHVNCTLLYTTNKEIEEIGVHSRRTILFRKEIPELDKYLISVLNDFFNAQRLVLTELDKCKVEK